MTARSAFGSIVMMCVLAFPAFAGGKGDIQQYFNDAAARVKRTADPAEKRQIIDESFRTVTAALDIARAMPFISKDDVVGIDRFQSALQEKHEELVGANGFTRVPDTQLNAFANYVVQDMEQADQVITISLVTLLIILLVILIIV